MYVDICKQIFGNIPQFVRPSLANVSGPTGLASARAGSRISDKK